MRRQFDPHVGGRAAPAPVRPVVDAPLRTVEVARMNLRLRAFLACGLILGAGGCAQFNYDRLKIGLTQREYEKILPAESTRRTEDRLCYLSSDGLGRTDAIIVVLARDHRLAARFHAVFVERYVGFKLASDYELTGEIDPKLADFSGTGPVDAVRTLYNQLAEYRGERLAADAHTWVAAGLLRVLQRWPHGREPYAEPAQLGSIVSRVAGGGTATIAVGPDGRYRITYSQSVRP